MSAAELRFVPVAAPAGTEGQGVVAILSLTRPEAANAFNDAVMSELVAHIVAAEANPGCRALVLRGQGKHFSAGADLSWMQASARLSYADNVADARRLTELFEALAGTPFPTLAVVTGSAFGGAVGLTAACDVAIAAEGARFCLSEIKLGLMPAVILPYLARKIRPGALRRLALTGRIFDGHEAQSIGLVERVVPDGAALDAAAREELDGFLQGAPAAQNGLKQLLDHVTATGLRQTPRMAEAIAAMRTGETGQSGLAAFFAKTPPPWATTLAPTFRLEG